MPPEAVIGNSDDIHTGGKIRFAFAPSTACRYNSRMEIRIAVEPYSPALEQAFLRLLPEHTRGIALGRLQWRFKQNPVAGSVVVSANTAQNVVGLNAYLALRMKINGQTVTAFQSMDTIVDASCRGQGLFSRLPDGDGSGLAASDRVACPGLGVHHGRGLVGAFPR